MDNIKINRAILHILDSNHDMPVLSAVEMDIENEIAAFLEKHIARILNDGELKKARFDLNDNEVYDHCRRLGQEENHFVRFSVEMAEQLFSIMKQNPDIPSGDLLFSLFEMAGTVHLAILKLNYRPSYIHFVANTDEGNINRLIKQKTTLPGEGQKVDECAIINLANLQLEVLEKQYEIAGDKEFYLSKYFLKCHSDLSCLQKIKILDKAVSKVTKKHFDENFEKVAELRSCIAESIDENSEINVDRVAEQVFGKHSPVGREYIEEVKKAGLVEDVVVIPEENNSSKKFRTQKLKTDSGIEINFPSNCYNNKDVMEFINNPDGTISILIKNVGKVTNK